jgi:hypothetical protein
MPTISQSIGISSIVMNEGRFDHSDILLRDSEFNQKGRLLEWSWGIRGFGRRMGNLIK